MKFACGGVILMKLKKSGREDTCASGKTVFRRDTDTGRRSYSGCKTGKIDVKLWRIEGETVYTQFKNLIKKIILQFPIIACEWVIRDYPQYTCGWNYLLSIKVGHDACPRWLGSL